MSDSEPDLYSFLQSKNFSDGDDADETDEAPEPETEVQTVDSFDSMLDGVDDTDSDVEEEFGYSFDDDELGEALRTCSEDTLDEAPFGIVKVDDDGIVQFYNRYESQLAGVDPEDAMGRNFFWVATSLRSWPPVAATVSSMVALKKGSVRGRSTSALRTPLRTR